jgi:hypothetical protein
MRTLGLRRIRLALYESASEPPSGPTRIKPPNFPANGRHSWAVRASVYRTVAPDLDVRVREHPEHRDVMLLMLVHGGEQIELDRWHEDARHRHSLKAGAAYSRPAKVLRRPVETDLGDRGHDGGDS